MNDEGMPLSELEWIFYCRARRKKLPLEKCLDDYMNANAFEKRRIACWRCPQGRGNRNDFANDYSENGLAPPEDTQPRQSAPAGAKPKTRAPKPKSATLSEEHLAEIIPVILAVVAEHAGEDGWAGALEVNVGAEDKLGINWHHVMNRLRACCGLGWLEKTEEKRGRRFYRATDEAKKRFGSAAENAAASRSE